MNKTYLTWFICALLCMIGCSKSEDEDPVIPDDEKPTAIAQYLVETVNISAPSLKNSLIEADTVQHARVFLPPYYNSDTLTFYPVVYFVHGYSGSYSTDYDILAFTYKLMKARTLNQFIIVKVNCTGRLGGTFGVNSPVRGNWEDHLVSEVIDFIDSHYRTLATKESRGIAGSSMGGFCALNLGLKHPDIYNLAYAISPGVITDDDLTVAYNQWVDLSAFNSAYGASFSPDTNGSYPFAEIPAFTGSPDDNRIVENWLNGFGNFDVKINQYLGKSDRLKRIGIDYGTADYYVWIPRGSIDLCNMLSLNQIPYEVHVRENGAHDIDIEYVTDYMLPFFSENLVFMEE